MKARDILIKEATDSFIKTHIELSINTGNTLQQLLRDERNVYARTGIMWAIDFMMDEIARTKK